MRHGVSNGAAENLIPCVLIHSLSSGLMVQSQSRRWSFFKVVVPGFAAFCPSTMDLTDANASGSVRVMEDKDGNAGTPLRVDEAWRKKDESVE